MKVEMRKISKRFGDVQALDNVSLEIREAEVLGLLGENGAGKTTLMNILYGLYRPDSGEIFIDGRPVRINSPKDAISHGIFMVHQHFKLIPSFTALENIIIGYKSGAASLSRINVDEERARIEEIARRHRLEVPLNARVRDLPLGVRQRIEILKALYRGARLLILDEPTTNLTPQESEELMKSVRMIRGEGVSVVLITHKIREVEEAVDRVVVLRKGRVVGIVPRERMDPRKLVEMMVGRPVELELAMPGGRPRGSVLLRVEGLRVEEDGAPILDGVNIEVREGEIVGIAGVAGNGQRELLEAIFGALRPAGGRVVYLGEDVTLLGPREKLRRGMAFIPEDRLRDGVLPTMTVAENIILGYHAGPPYTRGLFIEEDRVRSTARRAIEEYDVRTPGEDQLAGRLSGGNIQKLMIARALVHSPRLVLAYHPTRGLDVGMTEKVLRGLIEVRERGGGVLLVSEDLDQLLMVSDRIVVMYRGRVAGVLERHEFDKNVIGEMMMGLRGTS